jgi:outer membrane receptor protein involved in Fe transport
MVCRRLLVSVSCAAFCAALVIPSADAQTPAPAPHASDEPAAEVIVVTATKREESLQDVPLVVTAIGEALLEDAGVDDIRDLQILTPGLTVTSTSSEASTTARIRGIGTVGDNIGLESSVLVNIDGVYRPRNGVGFGDLGDIERIEVLKGPQGTLFGKNASAGVINIITAAPTFEFEAETELTASNYDGFGAAASFNGPILGDMLAGRMFLAKRRRGGFLDVSTGPGPRGETEDNGQDYFTLRGQLLAVPADQMTARLILDYSERDENCCAATQLFIGQAANSRANLINATRPGSIDTVATPFDRNALSNRSTRQDVRDQGASLELNWDITDAILLTSISAIRNWQSVNGQDSDFTAADLLYRPDDGSNFSEFEQISQEVRASGQSGRLSWLAGVFYSHEDVDSGSVLLSGSDFYGYFAQRVLGGAPGLIGITPAVAMQPGSGYRDRYSQTGDSYALFTDNTFELTDVLRLNLGLRWTRDEKELTTRYTTTGTSCDQAEASFPILVGAVGQASATTIVGGLCLNQLNNDFDALGPYDQERSEEAVSGAARILYDLTPDAMVYAAYARGFKAGGFNLDREGVVLISGEGPNFTADPNTEFRGEYVDAFEIGSKNEFLDNSLTLNLAAFHQTYTDFQLNTFAGTAFVVETLPEVVSQGVDADFLWNTPLEQLTVQGGVTYASTKISGFTAADLIDPARFNSLRRLPGATLSFAPEWSGALALTWEQALGDNLLFRANVSAKYSSDYNTGSDLHPSKQQDAYSLVNARLGVGADNDLWRLELWGQNVLDQDYLQVGFNGPFQVDENNDAVSVYDAFLGAPATYGLTLRTHF